MNARGAKARASWMVAAWRPAHLAGPAAAAHRRDIDGLRALAVVPVVLFHAGLDGFQGGYVGVDVFFVISGFLITTMLAAELDRGTCSITAFYERRARRILPALLVVLAACMPAAWVVLGPSDLDEFAQSLVAIALFASNVLFWAQTDYFGPEADLQPTLHTWSLAVEEQFYLLFPLALAAVWRLGPRRVLAGTSAVAGVSLAVAAWQVHARPEAAFFLLPARAWELLVGALAALWWRAQPPTAAQAPGARARSDAVAAAGLLMILAAVLLYDQDTPFPGPTALPPVVGTALVLLHAPHGVWVARLLSLRLLVGIGLVSYSAYLWHQPLFAFARQGALGELPPSMMAALVLLTFVLAAITWRWVEQPFRRPGTVDRRRLWQLSAAGVGLCTVLGVVLHLASAPVTALRLHAVGGEVPPALLSRDARHAERERMYRAFMPQAEQPFTGAPGMRRVLVLGDSVSMDVYGAVMARPALFPGVEIRRMLLDDRCMPDFDHVVQHGRPPARWKAVDCAHSVTRLHGAAPWRQAEVIVLSAQWTTSARGRPHEGALALASTLAARGREVRIVGVFAMMDAPSIAYRAARDRLGTEDANRLAYRTIKRSRIEEANDAARALAARQAGIAFLDKQALFCNEAAQRCTLYDERRRLIFADGFHMTDQGALHLGARMAEQGWLARRG